MSVDWNHNPVPSKMTWPQRMYLGFCCCPLNFAWQEAEYQAARWYHMMWLLIPIIGIIPMMEHVKYGYRNGR